MAEGPGLRRAVVLEPQDRLLELAHLPRQTAPAGYVVVEPLTKYTGRREGDRGSLKSAAARTAFLLRLASELRRIVLTFSGYIYSRKWLLSNHSTY
jgi:hypothetical protein